MGIDVTTLTTAATSIAPSSERAVGFIRTNDRTPKPRHTAITEDVLETMGAYVDALKFAVVSRLIEICHAHQVLVSTGGFIEYGSQVAVMTRELPKPPEPWPGPHPTPEPAPPEPPPTDPFPPEPEPAPP